MLDRLRVWNRERKAKKVIRTARTILMEEGWKTGSMGTVGGPSCLMGALRQAGCGEPHDLSYDGTDEGMRVIGLVAQGLPQGQNSLVMWNDDQRSEKPVLELLEKVSA